MVTPEREKQNENDALDAISNLENATTGDIHTIYTPTITNNTLSKQLIKPKTKLLAALENIVTKGSGEKIQTLMLVLWIKNQPFPKKQHKQK